MSPPHVPGVPGTRLPAPVQEVDGRPRTRQPSHVEIADDTSEGDRSSRLEQEQFHDAVRAKYGKASFQGPAWAFLVGLLVIACGAIVYLATRHQESAEGTKTCLTKDQFDESMRQRDERLSRRFDTLETDTSYLKVAVRLVQDRLPPQK